MTFSSEIKLGRAFAHHLQHHQTYLFKLCTWNFRNFSALFEMMKPQPGRWMQCKVVVATFFTENHHQFQTKIFLKYGEDCQGWFESVFIECLSLEITQNREIVVFTMCVQLSLRCTPLLNCARVYNFFPVARIKSSIIVEKSQNRRQSLALFW